MPVRCDSMSRMVTARSSSSLENLIDGTYDRIGVSQSSFPSSTRSPAATAVNSFVFDAIGCVVVGVYGIFFP